MPVLGVLGVVLLVSIAVVSVLIARVGNLFLKDMERK